MTSTRSPGRPVALAVFLVVAGAIGFTAAFALTLEKFVLLADPQAALGCDFSLLVQCGRNLTSAQGEVFGFPNPLIGIAGFAAVIVVGMAVLAGGRFAAWFWVLFNIGLAGALAFVVWLVTQSIFVLGTLCPWCMVVWSVTIPLFLAVTLYNASAGNLRLPRGPRRVLASAYGWVPLISVACYLAIAVVAQLRLDVISYL
ncbi:vitamin K epoxide reductase family protein [Marisediminicola senii]|uniref:vitamin K epoxide reductase family protein n=1 Tax=Marisediminicola senii TaxID=2711233 RepID=UPI0013EA30C7|nr:vitamin K epoxide reductase family protein [Marisediminicola senii]